MANITRRLAIPALGLATTIALAPAALAQEPPTPRTTPQTNVAAQSNSATVTQNNRATQVNARIRQLPTPSGGMTGGGGGGGQ